jgi:hypothetical protein
MLLQYNIIENFAVNWTQRNAAKIGAIGDVCVASFRDRHHNSTRMEVIRCSAMYDDSSEQ